MTETVDYYLDRITPWHAGRPRFRSTVENAVAPLVGLQEFLAHLPQDFDLDDAIGVQLDAVGERVGRSRFIPVPIAWGVDADYLILHGAPRVGSLDYTDPDNIEFFPGLNV
jgi:hypothetical protein